MQAERRYRDSRGRFAKRPTPREKDSEHQLTREVNRIADGGKEDTEEDVVLEEFVSVIAISFAAIFVAILILLVCAILG